MDEEFKEFMLDMGKDKPMMRFNGVQLAHVSSERHNSRYWTEITAYKTQAGRWIVRTVGATDTGEQDPDRIKIDVFDDVEALTKKVGYGRLGINLYKKLGIDEITIE